MKYDELIEKYKIGGFIEKIKTHLSEYNGNRYVNKVLRGLFFYLLDWCFSA